MQFASWPLDDSTCGAWSDKTVRTSPTSVIVTSDVRASAQSRADGRPLVRAGLDQLSKYPAGLAEVAHLD